MNGWKKNLVPALWAFGGVLLLLKAVLKPLIEGEPFDTGLLGIAFMYLTFAVLFFAAGRRSGGGSGRVPDAPDVIGNKKGAESL